MTLVADALPFLRDLGIAAGSITAIILALAAISRVPPIRWISHNVLGRTWWAVVSEPLGLWFRSHVREEVAQCLVPITARIDEIEREFKPNGGDSLRDKVDQVAEAVRPPG